MIDARLLLPAASAWAAAVIATWWLRGFSSLPVRQGWSQRLLLWCLAVALSGLVLTILRAFAGRSRTLSEVARLTAIGLAGALVGVLAAAAHMLALAPDPVGAWVQARAMATVRGVVTTEAVSQRPPLGVPWPTTPQREFRLATSIVAARGQAVAVDLPLLVRMSASATAPPVGATVLLAGRLGPSSAHSDTSGAISLSAHDPRLLVVSPPGLVDRVTGRMRIGLRESLAGVPPNPAALVAGLAVGDESGQSAALRAQMRASGLSHLTAVSGGNVSIVVVAVLMAVTAIRLPLVARVVAALAALVLFVSLVGPAPSVIRAAAMAGLVLVGMLIGGRQAGPSILAAAVLALVILAPGLTASWGFALSAVATAGVIVLSGPCERWLRRWPPTARLPPAVLDGLGVTIAAQVATLPLLVAMGSSVGWVSVPANLLAMPVVAPVTVLGLLAAIASPLMPAVATGLAHAASWPAGWIALVAQHCSELPGARLPLPSGWAGVLVLLLASVGVGAIGWGVRRMYPRGVPRVVRSSARVLVAAVLVVGVLSPPGRRAWPPAQWLMIMCDVGQGDGLLLNAGRDAAVVVDAGPDPDAIGRCLDDAHIATVPALLLTHFHADHVGGLAGVLRDRVVGVLLTTPVRDPPLEAAEVDRLAAAHGLPQETVTAGDARVVGPLAWRAVWPRRIIPSRSVPNNSSVVLVVETSARRLLLMGDAEPEAVSALSPDIVGRHYDVIKVPHHGSRYQHPLLTSWAPAPIALISVGAGNDYGHPAQSTVQSWQQTGALVARTDENGDVAIVSDDSGVSVVVRRGSVAVARRQS